MSQTDLYCARLHVCVTVQSEKRFEAWLTACVVFLLRCRYVRPTRQPEVRARRGLVDSGTFSTTLPKARRPPFTDLKRTSWTGCNRATTTTTVDFHSVDK